MARPEVKEVGRAVRRRIDDDTRRQHRPKRYAAITRLHPLTAELTEGSLVLDEDDLVLGQWVEQYRKQYGLRVGDTLTVHRMGNGDWVADDVVSDRKIRRLKSKAKSKKGGGEGGEGEEEPEEGSEELEEEEEAEEAEALAALKGYALHGTDPNFPRPACGSCEWHGTVEPVNALDHDTWINPPSE